MSKTLAPAPVRITTTMGDTLILDAEVAAELSEYELYRVRKGNTYTHAIGKKGEKAQLILHTLIIDTKNGEGVTHKNGNDCDYRRENLEIKSSCARAAEARRSRKVLKGVSKKAMVSAFERALQENPTLSMASERLGEIAQDILCAEYGLASPLPNAFFTQGRAATKAKHKASGRKERNLNWARLTENDPQREVSKPDTSHAVRTITPVEVENLSGTTRQPEPVLNQKTNVSLNWLQAFHDPDHAFHSIMTGTITPEEALQRAVRDLPRSSGRV